MELPGLQEVDRAQALIGQTAQLEFKLLESGENTEAILKKIDEVLAQKEEALFEEEEKPEGLTETEEKKKAEEEIMALQGIIPICSVCKEIRDDRGYWKKLENYISEHYETQFTHSLCDNCLEKYYPEEED